MGVVGDDTGTFPSAWETDRRDFLNFDGEGGGICERCALGSAEPFAVCCLSLSRECERAWPLGMEASLASVSVLNVELAVTAELPLVDREIGGGGATIIAGGFGFEADVEAEAGLGCTWG